MVLETDESGEEEDGSDDQVKDSDDELDRAREVADCQLALIIIVHFNLFVARNFCEIHCYFKVSDSDDDVPLARVSISEDSESNVDNVRYYHPSLKAILFNTANKFDLFPHLNDIDVPH